MFCASLRKMSSKYAPIHGTCNILYARYVPSCLIGRFFFNTEHRPFLWYGFWGGICASICQKKKCLKNRCNGWRLIFDLMSTKNGLLLLTQYLIKYNTKKLVILSWPFTIVLFLSVSFCLNMSMPLICSPTTARIVSFWKKKNLFFLSLFCLLLLVLITQTIYLFIDFHRPFLRFISSIACDIRLSSMLSSTRLGFPLSSVLFCQSPCTFVRVCLWCAYMIYNKCVVYTKKQNENRSFSVPIQTICGVNVFNAPMK